MTPYSFLLEKIHHGFSPYSGFPAHQWGGTWYSDPGAMREILRKCVNAVKPGGIIIEVGSFVGESAIFMAKCVKERRIDAAILCVDTWYLGYDHWLGAPEKIRMHFGRPDLFYKFMANVVASDCTDVIVPFAMDSVGAARVLKWMDVKADFIYVDASHEQGDAIRDYEAYWELLSPGGRFLCDDWSRHFPGVMADGELFMQRTGLRPVEIEGEKVLFIKP
jgi:SAM-dependent methyltransferase